MKNQWPEGYDLLTDNVVALDLVRIELPPEAVFDKVGNEECETKVLRSYRAIGAVADVRYHSGRVIPSDVQAKAIQAELDSGRQMTMYIDHPAEGINCGKNEGSLGRIEHVAGLTISYHFDADSGQTILDRIDVLDVPQGRKFLELIDAGIKMGLSQRAIGKQETQKLKINGSEVYCLVVTDIYAIFGWDFLHLDSANAGSITELQPLTDKAMRSLGRSINNKKEPIMGQQQTKETKNTKEAQPINDNKDLLNDAAKKVREELAVQNAKLGDAIIELDDGIREKVGELEKLNDDFKERYTAEEAVDTFYSRIYTASWSARVEIAQICNGQMSEEEKNEKLQELLTQMKECFSEISEAYISAFITETEPTNDKKNPDKTEPVNDTKTPEVKDPKEVELIKDKNPAPAEYVPPENNTTVPANQEAISTSADLLDSVRSLLDNVAQKSQIVELKGYAKEAVGRQKLTDKNKEVVLSLVDKMIRHDTTEEQIEESIKDSVQLIKSGQATERLNDMGLQPQGAGAMRIEVGNPVHSLGDKHLAGVKLLTDSFSRSGSDYSQTFPEKEKVPQYLQSILDKFDEQNAVQLKREKEFLEDKLAAQKGDGEIFDASTAADFNTPATISRMIIEETYADDLLPGTTSFGTMDNHRDSTPITRWRRDDSAKSSSFRPSVLQRQSVRGGELSAITSGKLITEFFDIDAVARKMMATLSLEFLTRSKRRTDVAGAAMAIKNLILEVRRILQMDVFFEQIRAAAFHGSSAFTKVIDGTGTSLYRVHGTTDANTTTIVPNDPRSLLQVFLGTTSGNRTEVPEFGTTSTGGGPGNAFWYVIEHSTSKITFVDATGAVQNTATAVGAIQVVGYKADKEKRFDMTLPASTRQEQHMNALLFACSDQAAAMSSGQISAEGYYDPNIILASSVMSSYMKQAAAYQTDGRRNAFRADAEVREGNYGFTAGMSHWGSKIFPDDFIVVGNRDGVLFRVYEPAQLRGPIEARNSSGQIIGGEEYYTYQEDSIATPLHEKFSLITLFRS